MSRVPISAGRFIYERNEEKLDEYLPIYMKPGSIDAIYRKNMSKRGEERRFKGHLFIEAKDSCFLNQDPLEKGFYKIHFSQMERRSMETELFNHKSAYDSLHHNNHSVFPNDCTNELIAKLMDYFDKN